MFLGSCLRELGRRITAGHHGRPGVLLTCPHKRLEQSHLCSGPVIKSSLMVLGTYGRGDTDDPSLSSCLRLPLLSSMRKQAGRHKACLSSQGWSALEVQFAAGGLRLWRERLPSAFHPGPVFYLSLFGLWLEYHGLGSIFPGLVTLMIKYVFLGQVACVWW